MPPEPTAADWLRRGRRRHGEGRFDEARTALEQALGLEPESAECLSALGRLLLDCAEYGRAASFLEHACERAEGDAGLWAALGEARFRQGRYLPAAEAFGRSASLSERDPRPAVNRAIALVLAGETRRATDDLEALAQRFPDDIELALCLAQVLLTGSPSEAERGRLTLERLIEREPDLLPARFELALDLARRKHDDPRLGEEAMRRLEVLLSLPGFPEQLPDAYLAHYALGACYDDDDEDLDRAESQYRACLRLRPGFAPALANLGALLERRGRLRAAFQVCAQAVHADPTLLAAVHNLGRLSARMDDTEAEEALAEAMGVERLQAACLARLVRAAGDHAVAQSHAVLCEAVHRAKNLAGVAAGRLISLEAALTDCPAHAAEARAAAELSERVFDEMRAILALLRPAREESSPFAVDEVLGAVRALLASAAPPGACVEHRPSREALVVDGDRARIADLVTHLGQNALAALPEGRGLVWLVARPSRVREGWVTIEVGDTGEGISPERLPDIKRPGVSTRPGGSGLGLWLCDQIARSHGGALELRSEVGLGTVARVRIPRAGPSDNRTARLRLRQLVSERPLEPASTEVASDVARGPRLLPGGDR